MKPQHEKYILENINKRSIKEISQELRLKEGKIRKFLEKQEKIKKHMDFEKETTSPPIKKWTVVVAVILIIILGFAVYGNSLNGRFIFDDCHLIKDNSYIKSGCNITKIFTKDIGAGAGKKYSFWRPFQMFTYMVDYYLWRLDVRLSFYKYIITSLGSITYILAD